MSLPRFLIAAPSSGSGKTLITCGILQVLLVLILLRIDGLACVWPPAAKKSRERT